MQTVSEPLLKPVDIVKLRPTQITIGVQEVEWRRKQLRAHARDRAGRFAERHMVPVVLGPKGRHYVIDHHHLARALLEEGFKSVFVTAVADFSRLDERTFWVVLDNHGLLHPFDAKGRRCSYTDIPRDIRDMVDDPFRSLAGGLRRAGGFAKEAAPFSEFLWADFLRTRMKRSLVEKSFGKALREALKLAKSHDADYLPGWCGPLKSV